MNAGAAIIHVPRGAAAVSRPLYLPGSNKHPPELAEAQHQRRGHARHPVRRRTQQWESIFVAAQTMPARAHSFGLG